MAAGPTYSPISTTTLSTTSTSVTFSSISGYTDLVVVLAIKASTTNLNTGIRFNSDAGNNYSNTTLEGNGSSTRSQRHSDVSFIRLDDYSQVGTSDFSVKNIHINNYSNSTTNKTALTRSSTPSNGVDVLTGMWRNTATITSVEVYARNDAFASGSTFTLYGIVAA
jgi:hypothetical protein